MRSTGLKLIVIAFIMLCCVTEAMAGEAKVPVVPDSCPCAKSINKLGKTYQSDPQFRELIDLAFANMKQLPPDYKDGNPWIGKNIADLIKFFQDWCTFLPEIHGSHDDGLKYIEGFVWFYYQNPFGVVFVQNSPGREILQEFVRQRGAYMDSKASTKKVAMWLKDPRVEKKDYYLPNPKAPDGGFKSYNQFFARTFKDQAKCRPQTMPERDYVISAPTDCVMNSIPQIISDENTPITTKGNQSLNIVEMLGRSKYAKRFIGGTALSCVLMPNTYHHYHSPVGGEMVEAKVIEDPYFGYDDFAKWAPQGGNVGYYGTDFSQFQNFKRGYFVVDTGKYGYVALVAVGLNTISSVVFEDKYKNLKGRAPVKRGERLGHFRYGGSLFIMIFEPGRYNSGAIQVRLGNQIGTFDTQESKKK
jgi:phosphatidylserine decarboxylase